MNEFHAAAKQPDSKVVAFKKIPVRRMGRAGILNLAAMRSRRSAQRQRTTPSVLGFRAVFHPLRHLAQFDSRKPDGLFVITPKWDRPLLRNCRLPSSMVSDRQRRKK